MRVTRKKALLLADAMLGYHDRLQRAVQMAFSERFDLIDASSFRHSHYPDGPPDPPWVDPLTPERRAVVNASWDRLSPEDRSSLGNKLAEMVVGQTIQPKAPPPPEPSIFQGLYDAFQARPRPDALIVGTRSSIDDIPYHHSPDGKGWL